MLKINPNPSFSSPVQLTTPGSDQVATITVTWRHKGRAALATWLRRSKVQPQVTAHAVPEDAGTQRDAAWLAEVMADWDGPQDNDGHPVVFGQAALASLLDAYPAASGELLGAYLRAMTESRAKN